MALSCRLYGHVPLTSQFRSKGIFSAVEPDLGTSYVGLMQAEIETSLYLQILYSIHLGPSHPFIGGR